MTNYEQFAGDWTRSWPNPLSALKLKGKSRQRCILIIIALLASADVHADKSTYLPENMDKILSFENLAKLAYFGKFADQTNTAQRPLERQKNRYC